MRLITVKYEGECRKCGTTLEVGATAIYERRVGLFCLEHEPKDPEEIRAYRQEGADRKANRLEEWAEKREKKATSQLNSCPSIRHDWAFITQPGHIPFIARMNKADDRAHESLNVAQGFRERADSLRHVQVKGDAERRHQAVRDQNDQLIEKGSRVFDVVFGSGVVVGVFKNSYRIKWNRSGNTWARDKSFVAPERTERTGTDGQ